MSHDHAITFCNNIRCDPRFYPRNDIERFVIFLGTQDWLAPLIISGYILVIPLWIWIAKKHQHTRDVLYNGWTPVMAAMVISSMGGLILDFMVSRFEGIAVFQPVINGVGGNLVAVQVRNEKFKSKHVLIILFKG